MYFHFPDRAMKGRTFWISRKGGILEKGGIDLEKGVMTSLPTIFIFSRYFLDNQDH